MGAFESKSWASLDDSTSSTPPEQRKVLQFDPRSPTSGINRTPIQVEKATDIFVDPRSPTREVDRTPIKRSDKEYREPWCYDSELSLDLSTSSVCRLLDDDPDASPQMPDIQVTPPGRGSGRGSRQTPQYERELCDMMDNLTDGCTTQEDTRLLKAKGRKITSKQKWGWGNHGMFKSVKPAEKPVKIHPNNRKVLFTATGNLPRSPLTTRNDENPRVLVQQKQMARLGLTKTVQRPIRLTSKYELFSDKENVEIE